MLFPNNAKNLTSTPNNDFYAQLTNEGFPVGPRVRITLQQAFLAGTVKFYSPGCFDCDALLVTSYTGVPIVAYAFPCKATITTGTDLEVSCHTPWGMVGPSRELALWEEDWF
jgi:hypothetical protein